MAGRTHHSRIRHAGAVPSSGLGRAALVLTILGLMAWPFVAGLRAQAPAPPPEPARQPAAEPNPPQPALPQAAQPALVPVPVGALVGVPVAPGQPSLPSQTIQPALQPPSLAPPGPPGTTAAATQGREPPAPTAPEPATVLQAPPGFVPFTFNPIPPAVVAPQPVVAPQRFQFTIDPKTPVKDLLPVPPKGKKSAGPVLTEDLANVPEVEFEAAPAKLPPVEEATKNTAHAIAKINHLNGKKTDGFLEALRGARPDLDGLPFAMGAACRSKGERSKRFALAVGTVRRALQVQAAAMPAVPPNLVPVSSVAVDPSGGGEGFWERYQAACAQEDNAWSKVDQAQQEQVMLARIAALMQVLGPESPEFRLGLVKYLSGISHVEATRALARLAIFSAEDEVRQAAIKALKVRLERDYTEVLVRGFRYPWPAVAGRAAEAVVKLQRTDLVPELVALLEEPDPRAPVRKGVNGKEQTVVSELVRVNHHRSCLLCHSPGNTAEVSPEALTAEVPVPGNPLPSPSEGYRTSSPDLLVRVDVTYLRQDFSVLLPVADAHPWPEMQRFDFLVRTRVLEDEEADASRDQLKKRECGRPSPYQGAALGALRELTGLETEPTAEAWRRILDLPGKRG